MLGYLNYNNLDINEELEKMEAYNEAALVLEPRNKACLFILGMLFARGIKIKILNESEIKEMIDEDFRKAQEEGRMAKSFPIMAYVWSKLGDNGFPTPDYSNVTTEIDNRVENIKRLGVGLSKIENNPIGNRIFLVCPVRDAKPEEKKWIEEFVRDKTSEGFTIHAPHLHTRQTDLFGGYAICTQNAQALASADEIDIYYSKFSTGTAFDLGVAYALQKPLVLLNPDDVELDPNDFMDNVIKSWPFHEKQMELNLNC